MKNVDLIFILLHLNMFVQKKVLATHNTHGPSIQICVTFSKLLI